MAELPAAGATKGVMGTCRRKPMGRSALFWSHRLLWSVMILVLQGGPGVRHHVIKCLTHQGLMLACLCS